MRAVRFLIGAAAVACAAHAATVVTRTTFGRLGDGRTVELFTLKNDKIEVVITNYGAIIVALRVPDRTGKLGNVVLGHDSLEQYVDDKSFLGAVVGRYGNRIAHGRFTLDGHQYVLATNEGENHLHGGNVGFHRRLWKAAVRDHALELTYFSPDGEEGYPGNLSATVTYSLEPGALRIDYAATTDKPTVLNLTNHSYFNLAGHGDILQHQVTIRAARFTPVSQSLIPTGELRSVAGTLFDFRQPHAIGERIHQTDEQLKFGAGYDLNWVLDSGGGRIAPAAEVYDPASGHVMDVLTDQPGLQFYTGNHLDHPRTGFCMETQHFPDSPNHPKFPSAVLRPGERYHSSTIFQFSLR